MSDPYPTAILNALDMVEWDRCTSARRGDEDVLTVFGWIPRYDDHRDFVVVTFADAEPESFTTSSAKWSAGIDSLLFGDSDPDGHIGCAPVSESMDLDNVVSWQRGASS